jgi:hypothetical protein
VSTPTTPAPDAGTITEERTEEQTDYRYDDGDRERFAHYVVTDTLMGAMVEGTPVRALCGKLWVPSRDPKRFPVCPECKEIYESDELVD